MQEFKWGIIGCGGIARKFVSSLKALNQGTLAAAAASSPERAKAFAEETGAETSYGSYAELIADPNIDIIYIATTHNFHHKNLIQCLTAGKSVLCEKPLTVNAAQAAEAIQLARQNGCFLMEGMWTRFLPAIQKAKALLQEGVIGDLLSVKADLSFRGPEDPQHRLLNRELAGGALLDVGVYSLSLAAFMTERQPVGIQSHAAIGPTGVDDRSFYLLDYGDGITGHLSSGVTADLPVEAYISGSKGFIKIYEFLWSQKIELHVTGEEPQTLEFPFVPAEGFQFEIAHVMECVKKGLKESPVMPLDETLSIIKTMDTMRADWGLTYPGE